MPNGVWFDGGRQWNVRRLVRGHARRYKEFHKVLERGGVIAGSSAGATIQGDYLVRGDTSGPNVMMTEEPTHQHGFAFLRKSAIDQHINTRNRWDDLIPVIKKYPDTCSASVCRRTPAIIVNGDQFEVMGKWKVAIHDNTRLYQPWEKPYYVLSAGRRLQHEDAEGREAREWRRRRGERAAEAATSMKSRHQRASLRRAEAGAPIASACGRST